MAQFSRQDYDVVAEHINKAETLAEFKERILMQFLADNEMFDPAKFRAKAEGRD